jgi:photosystem II stability/assembly factor-like uncharacterized protein
MKGVPSTAAARSAIVAVVLSLMLAACGGGDDAPPTELPQTLAVTLPSSQQALGATVAFASNAVDPSQALAYRWEFGDGATSSLASPGHAYAKPGVYTVRLTLANEVGKSLTATGTVTVADLAIVQGKVCSGADATGWCWQRPLPQGNRINDYAFVDDVHGWAVGEAGTVLVTSDAGATWKAQISGTESLLTQTAFVNVQVGWIAGTNGELLKTDNGGATWQRVSFGQNDTVQSLQAKDARTAWVTTTSGRAYVTTDGGAQWKRIVAPVDVWKLVVAGGSNVWAVSYDIARLWRSTDGGTTWSQASLPPLESGLWRSTYSSNLQFDDAMHGLFVAYEAGYTTAGNYVSRQTAWRTVDGGVSWQPFNSPLAAGASYGVSYQLVGANIVFASYYGLYNGTGASLQRTADGGVTWQAIALPAFKNATFASYRASSAQRLIVTDTSRRVYLSADGGAHWIVQEAGGVAAPPLTSVWFFDSREGLAISSDGSSVRTTDGGQTWVTTTPDGYYGWRRAQFLPDGGTGWVISDDATIYRSTDKGKTWLSPVPQSSTSLGWVTDFHFVDGQHGWAISPYAATWGASSVFTSSDGGATWQATASTGLAGGLVSLRFADTAHGVAVGPPGVAMLTTDAGATWSPRPTGIAYGLRRVTFVDAQTAVAVGDGGAIVRSTDQGQTWSRIVSPTTSALNDVRFVSATTGHAVGEGGTLLSTRDGGLSWALERTGAQTHLQAVFFVNGQTGWVAGDDGSILATVSGGR